MKTYIGFDVGGTKCASLCATVSEQGLRFLGRKEFKTAGMGPEEAIDRFIGLAGEIMEENGISPASGVGISCGGPLSSKRGVILCPPNLPGWTDVPIVDIVEKRLGIKTFLQNDAKACAMAENRFGAGKGARNMIFCTMGTGFGSGLILDGRVYCGESDMAGEVGHLRLAEDGPVGFGKRGSFEGFCSGGGMARLARQIVADRLVNGEKVDFCPTLDGLDGITAKSLCEAANRGDGTALAITGIVAERLGQGLSLLIDILNPEVIVIGSVFARNVDLFLPGVQRVIDRETIPYSRQVCRVVPAALGDSIGDYAAICLAMEAENK